MDAAMPNRTHGAGRRLACAALAAVLLCGIGGSGALAQPGEGQAAPAAYEPVTDAAATLESGGLSLSVDTATGFLTVRDEANGRVWCSNPPDYKDDKQAVAVERTNLASQLLISVLDEKSNVIELNTRVDSVLEEGLTVSQDGRSIKATYAFEKSGVAVTLVYRIEGRSLVVEVPVEEIVDDTKGLKITDIAVLPFFGAAGGQDKGYIFVPDGPGGLIYFNGTKAPRDIYAGAIYGQDRMKQASDRQVLESNVLLPFFGLHYDAGSAAPADYFCRIEAGEATATVKARVAGQNMGYNHAYASFAVRATDTVTMLSQTWAAVDQLMVATKKVGVECLRLRYELLDSASSGYAAVAARINEELPRQPAASAPLSLYLDVRMGVRKPMAFAGFVYDGYQVTSSFDQITAMTQELADAGVQETVLRLDGLDPEGVYYGKIDTSLRVDSRLGGVKAYRRFTAALDDGVRVYPLFEINEFAKGGNGFHSLFDAAKSVIRRNIQKRETDLLTNGDDLDYAPRWLLKPSCVRDAAAKLNASLDKEGIGTLALGTISGRPYSDYTDGQVYTRPEAAAAFREAVAAFGDKSRLLENPAWYLLDQTDRAMDVPLEGTYSTSVDAYVPFLQIVLRGKVAYATGSLNYFGNMDGAVLRAIEYGACPKFTVFFESYDKLRDSYLASDYTGRYADMRQTILAAYDKVHGALDGLEGLRIIDHRIREDGMRETTYEDGTRVLINYSTDTVNVDGRDVEAMSSIRLAASR